MTKQTPFPDELYMSAFGYELPEEKIARFPLEQRDASKLLVWQSGKIQEGQYSGIGNYLPSPCLLVFNNSRVVEARILFQKPTGGLIEIFCLEPQSGQSISNGMKQMRSVLWICLIGGASKWKRHQILIKEFGQVRLEARFVEKRKDDFVIEFSWTPDELSFASILHQLGHSATALSKKDCRYYRCRKISNRVCKRIGICSCFRAGLHFNEQLIQKPISQRLEPLYLTLHVGAGTFMPVKTNKLSEHHMHEEFIEVPATILKN